MPSIGWSIIEQLRAAGIVVTLEQIAAQALFTALGNSVLMDTPEEIEELRLFTSKDLGLAVRYTGSVAYKVWDWHGGGDCIPFRFRNEEDLAETLRLAALRHDADRVRPTRLQGVEVYGLDALPEIVASITDMIPMRVDFPTVLLGLGFNFDDARFLEINKVDGLPARDAGNVLGWDSQKTEAVRRRCARKAAKLVRTKAGVVAPAPCIVKVGSHEWPAGVFERLPSGRLILRTPE